MKNMNSEPIEKKSDAVSDDALKDVAGGAAYIEFGGYYTSFQTGESRVRVINGKSCPKCGNTIGWISLDNKYSGVKCDGCNTIILESYTSDDIEMI